MWTSNPKAGGTLPTATAITATANNGAGLIRVTSAAHGLASGDVVQILGIVGTVEANSNWLVTYVSATQFDLVGSAYAAAWVSGGTAQKITSKAVVLNAAQTLGVDNCEVIWSVDNTSTITLTPYTTDAKEGQSCMKIVKASPSNSTLYAHRTVAALNGTGYRNLTFWIKNSTAILANQWALCLCSDTAGATVKNTFAIPAIPSVGQWVPLTITSAEAGDIYNGIQSVALYSGSAAATTAGIFLDNIQMAATAGLNLQSLISKNTLPQSTISGTGYGNEGWYGIQSINGRIVLLDNAPNCLSNAGMGYYSATAQETVPTYFRETIKTALAATAAPVPDFPEIRNRRKCHILLGWL